MQKNVILKESKNCYFRDEERLLVGVGLKNIAIETSDAILVVEKSH